MLIVLGQASGVRLTTVSRVREELGLAEDAASDDLVTEWIEGASQTIADHCGRVFGRRQVIEHIHLRESSGPVMLQLTPATVQKVVLAGTELATEGWAYSDEQGLIRMIAGGFEPWPWDSLRVTYQTGWSLPGASDRDLPQNVEQACVDLVSVRRHGLGRDPALRSETVEGVGATSWTDYRSGSGGMPQHIAEKLGRYVRHSVG